MIAYDTANVLTHSPKRKVLPLVPYTYAVEVPDGHPYVGLLTVPSVKSNVFGLVVTGLSGDVVSASTTL